MLLTVLNIAFPLAPTSPDSVGGAEQVLAALDRALVDRGHHSLVVAAEGSGVAGQLWPVPIPTRDVITENDKRATRAGVQAAIDAALASGTVDLVHFHGMHLADYRLPQTMPVLMTLHLPMSWYARDVFERAGSNVHFCCVSESQRRDAPAWLQDCAVVENGVELPPFSPDTPRESFALVMGRICPEKNQHAALEAGTRAGLPVYLAGQVFPYREHREYFDARIHPLLLESHPGHKFFGPLTAERKQDLLARARCLLHPTLAPETSSLVAMEALAAGTPVIAYRSGALPQIVDDGRTGFLVDSVEAMAAAMADVTRISPTTCREAAEQRFSRERMLAGYFDLYSRLAEPVRAYA
jgi:glycosyltransferase involved in cell wall biosynthesis